MLFRSLPVLNNYPGWLAELITKEQCGFAVPPENPQAFADALEQAANQREKLIEMGRNGQQVAREQFNRSILSQKFSDWVAGA